MSDEPQIVVVEDDEEIREVLLEVLEEHGYRAVGAVHGRDALDKLRMLSLPPSLILLDLMMPVMDGKAFRQEQLQTAGISAIPVVVISAFRDVDNILGELRPAGFLKKPLELELLLETVQSYVDKQVA